MLAALAAMSLENEMDSRATFSLDAFCGAHPDLCGLLHPTAAGRPGATLGLAELVHVEDDDGEIYSIYFDHDDTRKINVSLATPPASTRCAVELLNAVHFAALARDNPRRPPRALAEGADEAALEAWSQEQSALIVAQQVAASLMTQRYMCHRFPSTAAAAPDCSTDAIQQLLRVAMTKPFSPPPSEGIVASFATRLAVADALGLLRPAAVGVAERVSRKRAAGVASAAVDADATSGGVRFAPYIAVVELARWRLLSSLLLGGDAGALLSEAAAGAFRRLLKALKAPATASLADLPQGIRDELADGEGSHRAINELLAGGKEGSGVAATSLWTALTQLEWLAYDAERARTG